MGSLFYGRVSITNYMALNFKIVRCNLMEVMGRNFLPETEETTKNHRIAPVPAGKQTMYLPYSYTRQVDRK
jgi:hypothetical protein